MGQSKGGGYMKKETLSPEQQTLLNQILAQAQGPTQQAQQAFASFLPGGAGAKALTDEAMRNYQQRTIPSILNALGTDSKGSSGLNQALAASASDLNSNIAAQLAQLQFGAAHGLAGIGQSQTQLGLGTPAFAYLQRQQPLWQSLLLGGIPAAGHAAGSWLSAPRYNMNIGNYG